MVQPLQKCPGGIQMLSIYKAKLTTKNKSDDQIKRRFDMKVSQNEIDNFRNALNSVNGLVISVAPSLFSEGSYVVAGWKNEDDHLMRDFIYAMEQDPYFGSYIGDREVFLKDWKNNEYEPMGAFSFEKDDIELLEKITNV